MQTINLDFPKQGFVNVVDQFMLGEDILVAPVVEKGARKRTVQLPKGKWETPSGKVIRGGKSLEFDVALDELLYFKLK
ncbi:TIM-barrel domain-containing protein [uncultured Sunxiuqinia sp.]|uniref:TIM-barrel domain-containing protein n=1 Tax=uncultured Sunxiuqinia sp. TaxID=1573825 RepID=UPI002632C907|nr:TIM-barrel domain-containing protein [uncultured Sunxiuqinia sp.]